MAQTFRRVLLIVVATLGAAQMAAAQSPDAGVSPAPAGFQLPAGYAGPPPPVAPETMARDAEGRVTVRAVRLTSPLQIDGALDEALYREVRPATGLIQIEPRDGEPAEDQTHVWVSFDDDNVYVSMYAFDRSMDKLVANEMRRDVSTIFTANDFFGFVLDTYYDRRNALFLGFNALGGINDGQVTNERNYASEWNPVWSVRTKQHADGWSAEAALPFKSFRYQPGRQQVWGFQVERMKRATNELSFLQKPPKARLMQSYQYVGAFATLVGIEAPPNRMSIDVKPFVTSSLLTDTTATPRLSNDPDADFGVDAKVGVTQSLIADLTYNTDFAQVEADEQQVNLTRFGLFFPEKRDFFLQNQGTFSFGGIPASGGSSESPLLFYSRRIGLNGARMVPIEAGGRLTGRVGKFTLGAINMQSGDEVISGARSTNFTVLRVKRDILRRSAVGAIYTGRSVAQGGTGSNQAYGLDATLSFFEDLNINTYWARTETTMRRGEDVSYRAELDYNADRYGLQIEHLDVGANFNPEVGFARRVDLRKNRLFARFSPRPRGATRIRKYLYQATMELFQNRQGVTESREVQADFHVDFKDAARIILWATRNHESLSAPFTIARGVTLPVGSYDFSNFHAGYQLPSQGWGWLSGGIITEMGTFYNGRKYSMNVFRGKTSLSPHLSIEPMYSLNAVRLVEGRFTSHLLGARATYTATPLMFTSALVQYNSTSRLLSANVRLRWEYQPGSELFIVLNEERDANMSRFPGLANRAFIVKVNRLLRF